MSKEKQAFLRQSHTLHPRPDQVRDPLFTSGSPFFDPCDLVQVKYELLRRVHVDGETVAHATRLFALSRPTFYAAEAAWQQRGIVGLLPEPPGPRQAHKLTEEIVSQLRLQATTCSSSQLVLWLEEHYQLTVHPRSIERALKRSEKKRGAIVSTSWIEPAYQAMRAWALHPSPMRPPGVAQLLQGGMAYWIDIATPLPDEGSHWESAGAAVCPPTPLSTIVAAMIAQVSS